VVVEASFRDDLGNSLGKIRSTGGTRSGPASTDIDQALAAAAREIAAYARTNFHEPAE
jgi:hypothetical protein